MKKKTKMINYVKKMTGVEAFILLVFFRLLTLLVYLATASKVPVFLVL